MEKLFSRGIFVFSATLISLILFPAPSQAEVTSSPSSLPCHFLSFSHSLKKSGLNIPSSRSCLIYEVFLNTDDKSAACIKIQKPFLNRQLVRRLVLRSFSEGGSLGGGGSSFVNSQDASDWVQRSLSEDRWIALDKLAHLLVSFSLVGIGYAVSSERGLGFSRNQARILSAGGTALIGIAKEIHDYRKGSDFCGKDLTADGLGIALGVLSFTFY